VHDLQISSLLAMQGCSDFENTPALTEKFEMALAVDVHAFQE
jgi:hypothetical protein